MKSTLRFLCLMLSFSALGFSARAQLSGTITVPSASYADLAAIVTTLNAQGVGTGGVTINLTPGNPQTAPAGGYLLGSTLLNASTASNKPILINGNGNTITAPVGTGNSDAAFRIAGVDYLTINSLHIAESAGNATAATQMEYGYALLKLNAAAPFDGCQYTSITNSRVTLVATNNATKGIYIYHGAALAPGTLLGTTSAGVSDAHNYITLTGDSLINCSYGVYQYGVPGTNAQMDKGLTIGTATSGNYFLNGGSTNAAYGIYTYYDSVLTIQNNSFANSPTQNAVMYQVWTGIGRGNLTISDNKFNLSAANLSTANYGVYNTNHSDLGANFTFTGNNYTGSNTAATSGAVYGLYNYFTNFAKVQCTSNNFNLGTWSTSGAIYGMYNYYNAATTTLVRNNTFSGLTRTASAGTTYGFYTYEYNAPNNGTVTVNNNLVSNVTTYGFYGLYTAVSPAGYMQVDSNKITNIGTPGTTGTSYYPIYTYYGTNSEVAYDTVSNLTINSGSYYGYIGYYSTTSDIHHNYFNNIQQTSGYHYGYTGAYSTNSSFHHNTWNNIGSQTGYIYNYAPYYAYGANYYNNTISNFTTASGGIYGMYITSNSGALNLYNNNVSNLTVTTGAYAAVYGIYGYPSSATSIYNNFISGFNVPATYATTLNGMYLDGSVAYNVYHNTIRLNNTGTTSGFGATGVYFSTSVTGLDLRNNIINVNVTPAGTGTTAALRRSSGTAGVQPSNVAAGTNGNIYYAPNTTNSWIYAEGTSTSAVNTFNISNDANFNTPCGLYKTFMGRDGGSFVENNLVAGTLPNTFLPTGTSYAQNSGVATSAPAVTTDYAGVTRGAFPDGGALEFTGAALDASAPTISFGAFPSPSFCIAGPTLTATISDPSGVNSTTNPPRLYFRKTTENDAFSTTNNTSSFNGWKYVTGTGSGNTFSFNVNYGLLTSTLAVGESIVYFVVAQDNNSTPNVGVNTVSFASGYCPGSVAILPAAAPTTAVATLNQYTRAAEPAAPVVSPSTATICPGTYATLTATAASSPINVTVGTGTVTNPTYGYPTPYGQYYGSAHDQYIIRASELTALGITAGNITSLSFNQSAGYTGNPLKDYTIKIAATAQSTHPGTLITTGFSTVFYNALYSPSTTSAGWVPHTFSTPFTWDGVSNIVVDITFLNCTVCNSTASCTTAYLNNGTVYQTATSFVSAYSLYADNNCTIPTFTPSGGNQYTYSQRPNMMLNGTSTQTINWNPIAGLFKNTALTQPLTATDTNKVVYASPAAQTVYTATNMYIGCNGVPSNGATVNVLPAPTAVITPSASQAICPGNTTTLTASANGTGFTYQWKKNGTAITGATGLTYAADTVASYTVTVTNTGTGCTSTSTATSVTFNPVPTASITAGGPTTFCDGSSVTLSANTGSGLTYQWKNGGTNIAGATASTYSVTSSGSYTTAVTNTSGCTVVSNAVAVTVNVTPATITPASTTTFCVGGNVVLNAPTGGPFTYQWKKDGTNITGATTSSYTATSPVVATNTYTVLVTNTATGCSATTNPGVVVTVGTPPAAPITPNAPSQGVCAGSALTLTTNTANGLSYQWKFNGSDISGATNVSYGAMTAGNYTVVVASGPGCSSTSSPVNVFINPLPVATATAGTATTVCQGDSVLLQGNSGANFTYQWRLNGTPMAGASNINYWAKQAGNWTVAITNANGCVGVSNAVAVSLNPLPAATITPASATTFCDGINVVLNGNSGSNLTYQWISNGNAITGFTSQSYTASTSANYQVRVTNTTTGCFATSPVTAVTANPRPVVATTPAGPNVGLCTGSTLTISVPNASGITYQWSQAGSPLTGATASSYTTTTSGSYTVKAINTATGCDATSQAVNVTVNPVPLAVTTPTGQQSLCETDTLQLTANTGAGLTYQWKLNNAGINGAAMNTYGASAAGSHTVEVTNQFGCKTTSAPVVITLKPKPLSYLTYQSALTFCQGSAVVLNSNNTEPGLVYQWYLNGQPFANGANFFTAGNSGAYTVLTTNSVGCSRLSAPVNVVVNAKPMPVIVPGANNVLSTAANNYNSYQWFRNNVAIPGGTSSSYNVLMNGAYKVFVKDSNGCENTSPQVVFNALAVSTTTIGNAIRVFPNPTSGIFKIEAPVGIKVSVRDMRGSTVFAATETTQLDLSALADGLYMVLISDMDGQLLKMERVNKTTR